MCLCDNVFHDEKAVTHNMPKAPDVVPHGLGGYRKFKCRCSVCRAANAGYVKDLRARAKANDEVGAKRRARRSESKDSVRKTGRARRIGDMEQAVIDECEGLPEDKTKATQIVAAKGLARKVDELVDDEKAISLYNSTIKQLMATMAELRGDKLDARTASKRKSGGRLATVGNLTKVRRAQ